MFFTVDPMGQRPYLVFLQKAQNVNQQKTIKKGQLKEETQNGGCRYTQKDIDWKSAEQTEKPQTHTKEV